jgi:ATP-dependent exoDNAse (exonuclease V) beta subunit
MTFNFIKLPELDFDLNAVTTETGRTYETPSGKKYPSITTVLSSYNKKALFEWRKRIGEQEANRIARLASSRGTKLHNVVEKYLLNEMSDVKIQTMMPDTKELFFKIKEILDTNIGNVYGIEQPLYSDRLMVAGRCDCIAEWDGELSIVDWKTSSSTKDKDKIENYFMQAAAYSEMFEERTNHAVNQIVIVIAVENGQSQVFREEKTKYLSSLNNYLERYYQ